MPSTQDLPNLSERARALFTINNDDLDDLKDLQGAEAKIRTYADGSIRIFYPNGRRIRLERVNQ